MIWDSIDQELRVRLAARNLPEYKYKIICEWLGVYTYILPSDRTFPTGLAWEYMNSTSRVHEYYLWLTYIEATLSSKDQSCLYQLTHESAISHTHPF